MTVIPWQRILLDRADTRASAKNTPRETSSVISGGASFACQTQIKFSDYDYLKPILH